MEKAKQRIMTEAEIQAAQQPAAAPEPAAAAVEPFVPTDAQAIQFVYMGRERLTAVWAGITALREWSESFDVRGGAPVFGNDALEIVYFSNDLQTLIGDAGSAERATFARLRTDI